MNRFFESSLLVIVVFLSSCSTCDILNKAIEKGNTVKAEKLVSKGADVNCYNSYHTTPLLTASILGNLELVKYLISKGSKIEYRKVAYVLKSSQKIGDQYKCNIEKVPNGGHTALTLALIGAGGDFEQVFYYLLEKGAQVNFSYVRYPPQPDVSDPNLFPASAMNVSITSTVEPEKEVTETPLTESIKCYNGWLKNGNKIKIAKYKSMIQALLKYGADKNAVNGDGKNAYQLANLYNLEEIIDLLKY